MRIRKEDKAGLYITITLHVVVIIVLLISQIHSALKTETSFLLDFSDIEEVERLRKELEFKEQISKRLDDLIEAGGYRPSSEIRNVAVDASQLKDDRNTDVEKLYEDARRLESELRGNNAVNESDSEDYVGTDEKSESKQSEETYSGPSVVAYSLDGRKARSLKIPAYRCMGGGDVVVIITVDKSGNVINAKVDENQSSTDQCLRNFAVRAARLSKFSASETAPNRQMGDITYRFISQ